MALIIHIDGGSRGNPGPAGAGVMIQSDDGTLLHESAYFLGHQTNNVAEYHALLRALQHAARFDQQPICVRSDSELLVQQITGGYRVKSARLQPLHRQVQLLLLRIPRWHFEHISREQNRRADELANLAMDQGRDVVVFDTQGIPSDAPPAAAAVSRETAPLAVTAPPVPSAGPGAGPVDSVRAVRVIRAAPPNAAACPADRWALTEFTVEGTLPIGLCVHAAHALVPTILAMQNTDPQEFAAVPTMTLRCTRPGCGATFKLSPVRSANGTGQRNHQ